MVRNTILVVAAALAASPVWADTIDGTLGSKYGTAVALQDTPTGFGHAQNQLDGAYVKSAADGTVQLMLTGNLADGNKLLLFIDTKAGGVVSHTDVNGYGYVGSNATTTGQSVSAWNNDGRGPSVLSQGFNPDAAIVFNSYQGTLYADYVDLHGGGTSGYLGSVGVGAASNTVQSGSGYSGPGSVTLAFNNSNNLGVNGYNFGDGGQTLGDPTTDSTGFEFSFSPDFLGKTAGNAIKFLPVITNGDGYYLSNQFLPGVGGTTNLAYSGDGTPNYTDPETGNNLMFDARAYNKSMFLTATPASYQSGTALSNATWSGGAPSGQYNEANFTSAATAPLTFSFDSSIMLSAITIDNPNTHTLTGPGTITLVAGYTGTAAINTVQGTHQISAAIVVSSGTTFVKTGAGTVTLSGANDFSQAAAIIVAAGRLNMGSISNGHDVSLGTAASPDGLATSATLSVPAITSGGRITLNGSASSLLLAAKGSGGSTGKVTGVTVNGGKIDVANVGMVVESTTPNLAADYASITSYAAAGRAGGAWNGPGISSSSVVADNAPGGLTAAGGEYRALAVVKNSDLPQPYITWNGQTVDANSILIAYALVGDTNLDGVINIDDYLAIDHGNQAGLTGWVNGGFAYATSIGATDYALIDAAYIRLNPLSAGGLIALHTTEFGAAYTNALAAVPEPASLMLLLLGATGLLRRKARG